jgi:hypothetical protein
VTSRRRCPCHGYYLSQTTSAREPTTILFALSAAAKGVETIEASHPPTRSLRAVRVLCLLLLLIELRSIRPGGGAGFSTSRLPRSILLQGQFRGSVCFWSLLGSSRRWLEFQFTLVFLVTGSLRFISRRWLEFQFTLVFCFPLVSLLLLFLVHHRIINQSFFLLLKNK